MSDDSCFAMWYVLIRCGRNSGSWCFDVLKLLCIKREHVSEIIWLLGCNDGLVSDWRGGFAAGLSKTCVRATPLAAVHQNVHTRQICQFGISFFLYICTCIFLFSFIYFFLFFYIFLSVWVTHIAKDNLYLESCIYSSACLFSFCSKTRPNHPKSIMAGYECFGTMWAYKNGLSYKICCASGSSCNKCQMINFLNPLCLSAELCAER